MDRLTPRQQEIVRLRCGDEELSRAEAAQRLCIAQGTVKCHVTEIMRRLGVVSFHAVCREYGIALGIEHGINLALLRTRPEFV
jgi:DNA-binding NarL/FixJ family response regulator